MEWGWRCRTQCVRVCMYARIHEGFWFLILSLKHIDMYWSQIERPTCLTYFHIPYIRSHFGSGSAPLLAAVSTPGTPLPLVGTMLDEGGGWSSSDGDGSAGEEQLVLRAPPRKRGRPLRVREAAMEPVVEVACLRSPWHGLVRAGGERGVGHSETLILINLMSMFGALSGKYFFLNGLGSRDLGVFGFALSRLFLYLRLVLAGGKL
jgi:hypothetical protein